MIGFGGLAARLIALVMATLGAVLLGGLMLERWIVSSAAASVTDELSTLLGSDIGILDDCLSGNALVVQFTLLDHVGTLAVPDSAASASDATISELVEQGTERFRWAGNTMIDAKSCLRDLGLDWFAVGERRTTIVSHRNGEVVIVLPSAAAPDGIYMAQ